LKCFRENAVIIEAFLLTSGERLFEPDWLAPRITFRNSINSLRIPNHKLFTLFDGLSQLFACNVGVDPNTSEPGSFSEVVLPRNQKQNRKDLFWNAQAVNRISKCNPGSQKFWFEMSLPVEKSQIQALDRTQPLLPLQDLASQRSSEGLEPSRSTRCSSQNTLLSIPLLLSRSGSIATSQPQRGGLW